jgi:hypothetical protein
MTRRTTVKNEMKAMALHVLALLCAVGVLSAVG